MSALPTFSELLWHGPYSGSIVPPTHYQVPGCHIGPLGRLLLGPVWIISTPMFDLVGVAWLVASLI